MVLFLILAYDTPTLTTKITAYVWGFPSVLPVPSDMLDGCKNLIEGKCPVTKGKQITYRLVHELEIPFNINATVDAALQGADKKNFVCARFNATVTLLRKNHCI